MIIKFDSKNQLNFNICDKCQYRNTFICDKRYLEGIEDFLPFVIEVHQTEKRKVKLILESYQKVLEGHRKGRYFTFNFTPLHCSEYTESCQCDEKRCWNYKEIPSRKLARCISILGVNVNKYIENLGIESIYFIIDFTDKIITR